MGHKQCHRRVQRGDWRGDRMRKLEAFVAKEVREVMPATILFLCLFHMIALTKAVALSDFSRSALRATTATVGALIVAKAILLVEALPISRRFARHRFMHLLCKGYGQDTCGKVSQAVSTFKTTCCRSEYLCQ